MKAQLWNGEKQIAGELVINDVELKFTLSDFKNTNLVLNIPKNEIKHIHRHRIYGICDHAIEVLSTDGRKNVFVVEGTLDKLLL